MHTFSFYRAPIANCTPCRSITIEQLYKYLTWENIRQKTADFRALSEAGRKQTKPKIFDYVTTGGEFVKRGLAGLRSVSGYVILDFDHIETDGVGLFCSFFTPAVLSFISPSGEGVKVIIDYSSIFDLYGLFSMDYEKEQNREYAARVYAEYWAISARIVKDQSCGKYIADESGKDIARACFLCFDENAFFVDRTLTPLQTTNN